MVRLSLVNMYLHGFADPHISEYDTLTSEENWNEYADVILANPPFMSPKGGIRPHNRFSVQSRRSEVLFVDYMAEHLTPTGRAGIIVPEGIIFQSQNAHKQLRKMLVEEYLVAVISLPAGVFNPYSGVKTSILILDKVLAKKTDHIAFFKVENDGFDLGAQRREIDKNDLPQVAEELCEYLTRLRAGEAVDDLQSTPMAAEPGAQYTTDEPTTQGLIVEKSKVAEGGEYNLSVERYRETVNYANMKWPMVELGEMCELVRGVTYSKKDEVREGGHQILRANNISKDTFRLDLSDIRRVSISTEFPDEKKLRKGDIFICLASGSKDHIGKVAFIKNDIDYYFGGFMGAIRVKPHLISAIYLFYQLSRGRFNKFLYEQITGANINNLGSKLLYRFQIPLPPLEVQREIVAEIEGYQRVIDGARAVVENYRPHIVIDPEWPMVELGKHFTTTSGGTPSKKEPAFWIGDVPWISPKDMKKDFISDTEDHITEVAIEASATKLIPTGSIVCVVRSGVLKHSFPVALLTRDMCINQDLIALMPATGKLVPKFLLYIFKTLAPSILDQGVKPGVTVQSFHSKFFRTYRVPMPSLETQQAIVAEIEAEQALVDANRELIARFEKKIQDAVGGVWGEE